ncbi:hypothetical protein RND81_14G153100 [Saponaria officinalis]|uniref:Uncharacterized protein n=1 Tax=Saponaria officinalis TaxID=3572 RepID=A0AAW1GWL3_SAPOF
MGLLERILKETAKQLDKATKRMNEAIAEQERLAKEAMSRAIAEQERLAEEAMSRAVAEQERLAKEFESQAQQESISTSNHFKKRQHLRNDGHNLNAQHAPIQQVPVVTSKPCPLTKAQNQQLAEMQIQMINNQIRRMEESAMQVGLIGSDYRLVNNDNYNNYGYNSNSLGNIG